MWFINFASHSLPVMVYFNNLFSFSFLFSSILQDIETRCQVEMARYTIFINANFLIILEWIMIYVYLNAFCLFSLFRFGIGVCMRVQYFHLSVPTVQFSIKHIVYAIGGQMLIAHLHRNYIEIMKSYIVIVIPVLI